MLPLGFCTYTFKNSTDSQNLWCHGSISPKAILDFPKYLLVIGSCVTFGGFLSKFSKCCFHSYICSSWLVAFSLAFTVFFPLLTWFTICHANLDCLSSTKFGNFVLITKYLDRIWKGTKNLSQSRPKSNVNERLLNTLQISLAFAGPSGIRARWGIEINGRFEAERPPASAGPPSDGWAATSVHYVYH